MEKKRKNLLDFIALEIGCDYVSDINLPINKEAVKTVVKLLNEADYELLEWENAVQYINGNGTKPENQKQAKKMIVDHLEMEEA